MGMQLAQVFEEAKKKGGLQAELRLAMKLGIPTSKVASTPDSAEKITEAKKILRELVG